LRRDIHEWWIAVSVIIVAESLRTTTFTFYDVEVPRVRPN